MRTYDHDPDEAFATKVLERRRDPRRGLARIERAIASKGGSGLLVGNLVTACAEATACAWALQRPLDEVRDLLRPAMAVLHDAPDVDLTNRQLGEMVPVPLVAGDRRATVSLARPAADMEPSETPNDVADRRTMALARLALDDPEAASREVERLVAAVDRPDVPPPIAEAIRGLPEMFAGVLNHDDRAWLAACDTRADLHAARFATSLEQRRNIHGLLDFTGSGLCRLALVAGLSLPEHSIFAASLIRDL